MHRPWLVSKNPSRVRQHLPSRLVMLTGNSAATMNLRLRRVVDCASLRHAPTIDLLGSHLAEVLHDNISPMCSESLRDPQAVQPDHHHEAPPLSSLYTWDGILDDHAPGR